MQAPEFVSDLGPGGKRGWILTSRLCWTAQRVFLLERRERVGLNFVSFQRDPIALLNILRSASWMGDANFGGIAGDPAVPAFPLMSLVAGGLFAVPPVDDPFPGHSLFGGR